MNQRTIAMSDKFPNQGYDVKMHPNGNIELVIEHNHTIVGKVIPVGSPSYDEIRNLFIKIGTAPRSSQNRAEMQNVAVPVHEFELGHGLRPRDE